MTINEIRKDGFMIRKIMNRILVTTDSSHTVFFSHRFEGRNSEHWTRPLEIGRAKAGFSKACLK